MGQIRKGTRSQWTGGNESVLVEVLPDGTHRLTDSKQAAGDRRPVDLPPDQWAEFEAAVMSGQFDLNTGQERVVAERRTRRGAGEKVPPMPLPTALEADAWGAWHSSDRSIQMAELADGGFAIRDSRRPQDALFFDVEEQDAFIDAIKNDNWSIVAEAEQIVEKPEPLGIA